MPKKRQYLKFVKTPFLNIMPKLFCALESPEIYSATFSAVWFFAQKAIYIPKNAALSHNINDIVKASLWFFMYVLKKFIASPYKMICRWEGFLCINKYILIFFCHLFNVSSPIIHETALFPSFRPIKKPVNEPSSTPIKL